MAILGPLCTNSDHSENASVCEMVVGVPNAIALTRRIAKGRAPIKNGDIGTCGTGRNLLGLRHKKSKDAVEGESKVTRGAKKRRGANNMTKLLQNSFRDT